MTPQRVPLAVVTLMLALMVASCIGWNGDVAGSRCECPILVETAPTIDFIGDGQAPVRVSSHLDEDPRPLQVDLVYDIAYSDQTVIEIAERFVDAGFETTTALETPLRSSPYFVEDDWEVYVRGTGAGGSITIRLRIVEPDRNAVEALAPLAEALGTVP